MLLPREVEIFQNTRYMTINYLEPTERERFLGQPEDV